MAQLNTKIENALNEARILVLGGQVLIGSAYQSVFHRGFDRLPHFIQDARMVALTLMLIGLGLLLLPMSYHQIVERGQNTSQFHRLVTHMLAIALFPFAIGLGVDVFTAGHVIHSGTLGLLAGIVTAVFALGLWYVFSAMKRKVVAMPDKEQPTTLEERIKEVLIEARLILPGAQALLGFQVAATLSDGFETLPSISKWIHLTSLLAIAATTIFLIAPAAYHRIALNGEDNEQFCRLASKLIIVAMVWLGLGVSGELFVVALKTTQSFATSTALAIVMLAFFYGAWFGYSYAKRRTNPNELKDAA